ncbi:MAG: hypothetical protein NC341_13665 [Blautia sp.]|nr:hypothetical protein [Blautia sp.]
MSYYVAAASADGVSIDSHFGHAKVYQMIAVDETNGQWEIVRTVHLDWDHLILGEEQGCCGHNEEVVAYVAEQLKECRYVLVEKIGPRPQKLMKRHGLDCLETTEDIGAVIEKLMEYHKKFSGKEST